MITDKRTVRFGHNKREIFQVKKEYHLLEPEEKVKLLDHIVEWVQGQHVSIDRELNKHDEEKRKTG